MKNPLTPAGIEPTTFRFVAQNLNHCATAVPTYRPFTRSKACSWLPPPSRAEVKNAWMSTSSSSQNVTQRRVSVGTYLSIFPVFLNSCRRLPETKRHSSLFLHWSGSKFLVVMTVCTPSIHVFLGRPLFLLSHGIQSIICVFCIIYMQSRKSSKWVTDESIINQPRICHIHTFAEVIFCNFL